MFISSVTCISQLASGLFNSLHYACWSVFVLEYPFADFGKRSLLESTNLSVLEKIQNKNV